MRAKRVQYTEDARTDLMEIRRYLTEQASARTAAHMIARLKTRIASVRDSPTTGVPHVGHRPNCRFVIERPYVIYYDFDGAVLVIIRVLHAARDRDSIMED